MTHSAESCRKNAEAALVAAERATLPKVRARALESAAKWTAMADRLDWVEAESVIRLDAINEARERRR